MDELVPRLVVQFVRRFVGGEDGLRLLSDFLVGCLRLVKDESEVIRELNLIKEALDALLITR